MAKIVVWNGKTFNGCPYLDFIFFSELRNFAWSGFCSFFQPSTDVTFCMWIASAHQTNKRKMNTFYPWHFLTNLEIGIICDSAATLFFLTTKYLAKPYSALESYCGLTDMKDSFECLDVKLTLNRMTSIKLLWGFSFYMYIYYRSA